MIISCKIYFVFIIFVVCANHENIFTTKISRSTVVHAPSSWRRFGMVEPPRPHITLPYPVQLNIYLFMVVLQCW